MKDGEWRMKDGEWRMENGEWRMEDEYKYGERKMKDEGRKFEFQKTELYNEIMKFIIEIYKVIKKFPESEKFCLNNQLQRASTSILLNFAEGWGRFNKREKTQYYKISRASLFGGV